jgi:nitrile hydratase subunit beta
MDGLHDLGGKQGFGKIGYTPNAPVFHAEWEKKANALYAHAVRLGIFNMDEYRHAIERMEPRHYMSAGYYERTLTSLASLLVEKGKLSQAELEKRADGSVPLAMPSAAGRGNEPTRRSFKLGDTVHVANESVPGHVRLPAYIRGKRGVVVGISPPYPFPDAHAHGITAQDEPTYDVRFDSRDLWGADCDAAQVHVGVFESYLKVI